MKNLTIKEEREFTQNQRNAEVLASVFGITMLSVLACQTANLFHRDFTYLDLTTKREEVRLLVDAAILARENEGFDASEIKTVLSEKGLNDSVAKSLFESMQAISSNPAVIGVKRNGVWFGN